MGAQWKARHKEVAANAKGKIFGKLAKEIMVAAKGGADPSSNSRLRLVVEQAKKASMPKDTLDRAIKKGAGLLDGGAQLERLPAYYDPYYQYPYPAPPYVIEVPPAKAATAYPQGSQVIEVPSGGYLSAGTSAGDDAAKPMLCAQN